ncbi:ABC transporter ATP-binding protein [Enterococcus lemanii]|uniref:ABC transporter ATP-binding protein n=1 Tax=Enterococcus lemanii TaxID=1159752 RepID=A0ABV9MUP7_9ENTE|nr:ABC transporter ATP-binding protein [Enterococcus lemanii]MBM7708985.1 ATP-binding cassette subfamily B protein [Enterococcus lemanii]
MLRLFPYAKNYRKEIILGPTFKFLEAVFELFLPLLMARLVDQGIQQQNWTVIWQMTFWMILASITGLLFAITCQYFSSIASQGFGTELRNQLMEKINRLSHRELNYFGSNTLITRLTNDINQMQLALAMVIRLVVRAPFLSIGALIMAFYIDWQIGLIFLAILPIFSLLLFLLIRFSVPLFRLVQQQLDRLNQLVAQNLSGVRIIRAFNRQEREVDKFQQQSDALNETYLKVTKLSIILSPLTTLVLNLGIIGIFMIGGFKVELGHLQQGEVLALVNYMNQMLLALIVVSNLVIIFTRAEASAKRINEVFDLPISLSEKDEPTMPRQVRGEIIFNQVDFRYSPEHGRALRKVSFQIPAGAFLGITGPTGSGKSTLTQLIPRFYDIDTGEILVDGINIKDWPLDYLRRQIAFVPQKSVLIRGTIRENLQWGKETATDADCWQALELAQGAEFVRLLPDQLDTLIVEGGKNFSGGQIQRLAIARALIAQPKILVLDDSLSALDYQTDWLLRQNLRKIPATVLLISQRVSSIQEADQILVLEKGRVVGLGSHLDLLQQVPYYQEIVHAQEEGESNA